MGERPNKTIGNQKAKHQLLADDVATQGEAAKDEDKQEADDEGDHAAHKAVDDPMGAA